jgi:stearoyl-CoA desaturase (delta-9 desaturase)
MDLNAIKSPGVNKPLDYVNIGFLGITPLVAVFGTGWYVFHYGVTKLELLNFLVMYLLTGMGITAGYHRYFAHRTYDCSRPLQLLYLVFGAGQVENSVLNWASDHRYHHRYVDQDEDPYNVKRGGLYAHIGWIFFKDTRQVHQRFQNVPDLLKDPMVVWQNRWYLPLAMFVCFGIPTLIGLAAGRPAGGLFWGGFLRLVICQHMTFLINSAAHLFGSRPYSVDNSARDNWWLGPITFGEGYHNFHHKFQADYRNGIRWYQFDMTKWWLLTMRFFGQAWSLRKTPESLILKAKLEVEMRSVERRLAMAGAPQRLWEKVQARLETGRQRLELAMVQYHQAKLDYRRQKDQWSADVRRQWAEKMVYYKAEFDEAGRRWTELMRAMNRIPHPSAQGLLTITAVIDVLKTRIW